MVGTTGAGVIVSSGSIGDDGANKTIGDVSRAMMGADNVLSVMIGTRAGAVTI